MQAQILINGISFDDFQNTIQTIVSNEVQKAVDLLTPPKNDSPQLLTRKQTAEILGVSLPTLHEWTKSGVLPAKRIGGSVRYEKHVVEESLKDIKTIKYRRA